MLHSYRQQTAVQPRLDVIRAAAVVSQKVDRAAVSLSKHLDCTVSKLFNGPTEGTEANCGRLLNSSRGVGSNHSNSNDTSFASVGNGGGVWSSGGTKLSQLKMMQQGLLVAVDKKLTLTTKRYELADETVKSIDKEIALIEAAMRREQQQKIGKAGRGGAGGRKSNHNQYIYGGGSTVTQNVTAGNKKKRKHSTISNSGWESQAVAPNEQTLGMGSSTKSLHLLGASAETSGGATNYGEMFSSDGAILATSGTVVGGDAVEDGEDGEEVYCTCKRVSFGNMVACDCKDCPIEWYHYECVNLTSNPKKQWICPLCREEMRKAKKDGAQRKKSKAAADTPKKKTKKQK